MLKTSAPYDRHTRKKKKTKHQPQSSSTSRPFSGISGPHLGTSRPFINGNSLHYPWFFFPWKIHDFCVFRSMIQDFCRKKDPWPFVVHGILNDFCKSLKIFTSRSDEASGFETWPQKSSSWYLSGWAKKMGLKLKDGYQITHSNLRWIPRIKLWKTYVHLSLKVSLWDFMGIHLSLWKLNYYPRNLTGNKSSPRVIW